MLRFSVKANTFAESELGAPCSTRDFLLPYQKNYTLHTEIPHETPLACHKLALSPLRDVEREALLMKIPGSNLWMELPAGTVLALAEESSTQMIFKLFSYQPTFSTPFDLHVKEIREEYL